MAAFLRPPEKWGKWICILFFSCFPRFPRCFFFSPPFFSISPHPPPQPPPPFFQFPRFPKGCSETQGLLDSGTRGHCVYLRQTDSDAWRRPVRHDQLIYRRMFATVRAPCVSQLSKRCPPCVQGGRGIFPRGKFRTSNGCGIFPAFFQCRCETFPVRTNKPPAAPIKHIL